MGDLCVSFFERELCEFTGSHMFPWVGCLIVPGFRNFRVFRGRMFHFVGGCTQTDTGERHPLATGENWFEAGFS